MDPRLTSVLAAEEDTYGTPQALSQAILCRITDFAPLDSDMRELDFQQSVYTAQKSLITANWMRLGLEQDLTGSGTAGTKPLYSDLLLGCGNSVTENVGVDTVIQPASLSSDSLTIGYNIDGTIFEMAGARGNMGLNINAGGHAMLTHTFWGIPVNPVDEALADMDLSGFEEPVPVNDDTTAFSIFGYSAVLQSLTVDWGHEIVRRNKPGDKGVYLRNRKMTGNLVIDLPKIAQHDFLADIRNHSTGALSCVIGSTAGNINTIAAPKVQLLGSPSITENDQTIQLSMNIKLLKNSDAGDDELVITQT
jgi:hypothetical protein